MTDPKTIIFISRIKKQGTPPTYSFSVMQPGGQIPLCLTYPERRIAIQARGQLMKGKEVHSIPTDRLFDAIAAAIQYLPKQRQGTDTLGVSIPE